MMFRKTRKKSQQEIVGFIIIVIIVVIVAVVFLGMYLKPRGGVSMADAQISNFLLSSAKVTTDCVKGSEPNYRTLGELTEDCFAKRRCLDERDSCNVLRESYEKLLDETWTAGEERPIRAYKMSFYYQAFIESEEGEEAEGEYGPKEVFLKIEKGNSTICGSRRAGTNAVNVGKGDIVAELEICSA